MKNNQKKPHAVIQGRNATIEWRNIFDAIIWRAIYNLWHNIKKDGRTITTIWYRGKCV